MLKNYLKLFFRNIAAHRIYSAINILGLALGLACCLAIALFVYQELSYDRHYENSARIFRIGRVMSEERPDSVTTSYLTAPLLAQDFPEFEQVARFDKFESYLAANGRKFLEEDIGFADNSFFAMFDFQWLGGNPRQALTDPSSIVLTQTLARKYFGDANPLGQVVLLNGEYPLRVTGLVADLPANTHINVDAWSSMALFENLYRDEGMDVNAWNFASVFTYVLLAEGVEIGDVAGRFAGFVGRHVPPGQSGIIGLSATNVADLHLRDSAARATLSAQTKVLIASTIALCILLIAVINFLNLATARSLSRAREVGIRKSNGAGRGELVVQFLLESFVMTTAAMLIAVGLVEVFLPLSNRILDQQLTLLYVTQPAFMAGIVVFTVILSLVAGYYPAMHLSAFQVASAFRRGAGHGRRGVLLRNCLVVLQFTIAIALIVCSLVAFRQLRLTNGMDLGFNDEALVVFTLPLPEDMDVNTTWGSFRNQLLSSPGVSAVTHSVYSPVQGGRVDIGLRNEAETIDKAFDMFWVDHDFFATWQIDLLAGRTFSADSPSDLSRVEDGSARGSIVLSEQAALEFGWTPEQAVGQRLQHGNGGWNTVIGVVADTVGSARQGVAPNVYLLPEQYNYSFMRGIAAVRLSAAGAELQRTLDHIDATWNAFVAAEPINRRFVDDEVDALYRQERMQMGMISLSALLAVLIACFGLYGLAAFNAEHRKKEIGVRKVMGGSVWSIVLLLTNEFSRLVLIANVIAWPLAYVAMERWLENFAYRIDLTPLIFIGSGLIALCIAWVTVGGTAAKAAAQKPVLALRYE